MRTLLLLLSLAACTGTPSEPSPPPFVDDDAGLVRDVAGQALGTTWRVMWVSPGGEDRTAAVQRVATEALADVDAHMSTWRDDSELSQARAADGPVPVSRDTALVVDAALDLAAMTGGAFDPTVQPLMELWGFHGERRDDLPDDAAIAAALEQVGWQKVRLDRGAAGPSLDVGGTALDLSAIAKGHAVDRVLHAVTDLGIASVFVEVGGEVRVVGQGPRGVWRVGVDLPKPGATPGQDLALIVETHHGAVATSGNYRNRYEVDGTALVHTMDPRVGRPIITDVASATVLAPDCRTADGLATALMVLDGQAGVDLVQSLPDTEAALLLVDGEGFRLRTTSGMTDRIRVVHDDVQP